MFLTSTILEVMPVTQNDIQKLNETDYSVFQALQKAYEKEIVKQLGPINSMIVIH